MKRLASSSLLELAFAAVLALGPVGLSAAPAADVFLDVGADARFFKSPASHPTLSVRLRQPAQVDALFYDMGGRLCAHVASPGAQAQCELALAALPPSSNGAYFFWLVASANNGQRLGVYPAEPSGGEIIQVRDSVVDREKQVISYLLPRAASVRVRAGFHEGPYLHPIVSSVAQQAGRHEVKWDGSGQNRVFRNLYDHPSLRVNVLAVSLPVNLLIDESPPPAVAAPSPPPVLPPHLAEFAAGPPRGSTNAARRSFWIQDDYELLLEVAQNTATRVAEVRVDAAPAARARLNNRRFELMLFLDTTFLNEDERSLLPFTYRMSTRGLAPGRHIVTVNTIDTDGNVGTRSVEFEVPKTPEGL